MTERDPLVGKIPLTLVTGFLGSGKTTLISRLVRHPQMQRVAVVINEVGEIGIDHDLVTLSSENITLLANGCICCSVRTDLQETLRDLFTGRRSGQVPEFDRVIIETTGLADPAPVLQTLVGDTLLAAQYRIDGLVTLVDAFHGERQIAQQDEAVKQIALADRIYITKSDLVDAAALATLKDALAGINPLAGVALLHQGEVEPADLTGLGLGSARASHATLSFLGESLAPEARPGQRYLGARATRHDSTIKTLSLRFVQPFDWARFSATLELLSNLRGPDLLRVKGIVNVAGKPVVVQGVQHIFHPPLELDRWPSADRDSRLVFIVRRIEAEQIRKLFDAVASF